MRIESPRDLKVCGGIASCPHQINYDMNSRDETLYQYGYEDSAREISEGIRNEFEECEHIADWIDKTVLYPQAEKVRGMMEKVRKYEELKRIIESDRISIIHFRRKLIEVIDS